MVARRGVQRIEAVGAASALVVSQDPARVGLLMQVIGANPAIISFGGAAALLGGLTLSSSERPVVLMYNDFGELVYGPFYAIEDGGATTLLIWEVFE